MAHSNIESEQYIKVRGCFSIKILYIKPADNLKLDDITYKVCISHSFSRISGASIRRLSCKYLLTSMKSK